MANNPAEQCLIRARDLYLNNVFSLKDYSFKDAMIEAGVCDAIASVPSNQQLVGWKVQQETNNGSPISFDLSMESKFERFKILYRILYETEHKKPGVVDVMKRAGYLEWPEIYKEGRVQSKYYARCIRTTPRIELEANRKEFRKKTQPRNTDSVSTSTVFEDPIVQMVKMEFEVMTSEQKDQVMVQILSQLDKSSLVSVMRRLPREKKALLGLVDEESAPGKNEELDSPVASSNQHLSDEDDDCPLKWNDHDATLVDSELTLEEKQCAEMLRELDLADQQAEEDRDDE